MISLLHPTVRPDKWQVACEDWFKNCDQPHDIEYILVPERAKFSELFLPRIQFDNFVMTMNEGPATLVGAFNFAATLSHGDVIMAIADDYFSAPHWDTDILHLLEGKMHTEAVIWANSNVPCLDVYTIVHPILTREYYKRLGYIFNSIYDSCYSDVEFNDVAQAAGVVIDAREKLRFNHTHGNDEIYMEHMSHADVSRAIYLTRKQDGFPTW